MVDVAHPARPNLGQGASLARGRLATPRSHLQGHGGAIGARQPPWAVLATPQGRGCESHWGPWRVASQSRLEGIFETGRRLIEIRDRYKDDRGKWSQLIGDNQWTGQSLLPFEKSHTQRLVRIAGCGRLPPHAGVLPDDSTTLGKLVSLSDDRFGGPPNRRYTAPRLARPVRAPGAGPGRRKQAVTPACGVTAGRLHHPKQTVLPD